MDHTISAAPDAAACAPSRRGFLGLFGSLGTLGALGAGALVPEGRPLAQTLVGKGSRIDFHHHFFSPEWVKLVERQNLKQPVLGFEQFKTCVGASPQQYLDWERMALATRRLANLQVSVADVAFELGFSAPSHFARFFSQHIGLPPSDFRKGMLSVGEAG